MLQQRALHSHSWYFSQSGLSTRCIPIACTPGDLNCLALCSQLLLGNLATQRLKIPVSCERNSIHLYTAWRRRLPESWDFNIWSSCLAHLGADSGSELQPACARDDITRPSLDRPASYSIYHHFLDKYYSPIQMENRGLNDVIYSFTPCLPDYKVDK